MLPITLSPHGREYPIGVSRKRFAFITVARDTND